MNRSPGLKQGLISPPEDPFLGREWGVLGEEMSSRGFWRALLEMGG